MSRMSNDKIEKHIRQGFDQMGQDDVDQLWNQPVQMAKGNEWYLDGIATAKRKWTPKTFGAMSAVAAALVLCTAVYLYRTFAVASTVYLDVNPRVEFQTNARNKVLSVKTNTAEGERIVQGMHLKNTDIDVAVNAVLGAMMRNGHIDDQRKMVPVVVDGKNEKQSELLKTKLEEQLEEELDQISNEQKQELDSKEQKNEQGILQEEEQQEQLQEQNQYSSSEENVEEQQEQNEQNGQEDDLEDTQDQEDPEEEED